MYSFSYLEPVCYSMPSSLNCCFLICIQISQEAGQVVWYSHLSQNFPQFIVIHRAKGFGIVNKAEIAVFLELSCFFHDPADVGNLISGSSAFSLLIRKGKYLLRNLHESTPVRAELVLNLAVRQKSVLHVGQCQPAVWLQAPSPLTASCLQTQ